MTSDNTEMTLCRIDMLKELSLHQAQPVGITNLFKELSREP